MFNLREVHIIAKLIPLPRLSLSFQFYNLPIEMIDGYDRGTSALITDSILVFFFFILRELGFKYIDPHRFVQLQFVSRSLQFITVNSRVCA